MYDGNWLLLRRAGMESAPSFMGGGTSKVMTMKCDRRGEFYMSRNYFFPRDLPEIKLNFLVLVL